MGLEEAVTKEITWFTLWSHLDLWAKDTSQNIDGDLLKLMESFNAPIIWGIKCSKQASLASLELLACFVFVFWGQTQ